MKLGQNSQRNKVPNRAAIIEKLKAVLDPERFEHSLRVEKTAVKLARKYGVSVKKASQAALLHDYARKFKGEKLLQAAKKFKLKIDAISEFEPKLLHAELGSLLVKRDFGITSSAILKAIKKHTIGSPRMNKLEEIIYLADHIEEGRDFAGVKKIRELAFKDMDKAIIASTAKMLSFLIKKELPLHSGTVQTRNYYLMKQ
jgi:predicted HD superfamily hydrolase involved in NAD metabolism